jgi:oligopeptidase B
VAGRDRRPLGSFELFENHLVVEERREGIARLRVIPWNDRDAAHEVAFDETAYYSTIGTNTEADTTLLRLDYTSMTTPWSVYDYDMSAREMTLKKRERIEGDFDPAAYETTRITARARDGVTVPISIVFRRDLDRSRPQPLLLYGYGAYGYSMDPEFSSPLLSLLDRGFIYAIAHVRGGQEMGRAWYEAGRLLEKRHTFEDFIDCADHLVAEGWTSSDRLFASGGSAGGLLIGAVANMRPDLFHGVVADVPFVDVVTTMLDESIPLTTFEYDEWGNPNERAYYDYMMTYSPYDNVTAQDYPHMLVITGLHDSQVQYWEPMKWVARLRELKTDQNRLLFSVNMEAGHGGASGRFKRHRETAMVYAFLLDLVGVHQ